MSIAKEIMEIHGGEILVESDFGVGTLVTLLFPSANQQDPQDPQDPADGPD
jgi:signal transduction histidine kinase